MTEPVQLARGVRVSASLYATMIERAHRIAELQFAQSHFDTPPDVQAKLREIGLVEQLAASQISRWVDAVAEAKDARVVS